MNHFKPSLRSFKAQKSVSIGTTIHKSFLKVRKFLSSQSCEFLGAGLSCGQKGGDDASAFVGEQVTVGFGDFFNQAMSSEQAQTSSGGSHLATQALGVVGRFIEFSAHVSIAKPVQRELSAVDNGQELGIGLGERIKGSVTPPVLSYRLAYAQGFLRQRVETCTAANALR